MLEFKILWSSPYISSTILGALWNITGLLHIWMGISSLVSVKVSIPLPAENRDNLCWIDAIIYGHIKCYTFVMIVMWVKYILYIALTVCVYGRTVLICTICVRGCVLAFSYIALLNTPVLTLLPCLWHLTFPPHLLMHRID